MRILSVDDRDDNRYLLEVLLRGNGYEVVSAANGAEALERLSQDSFDLIISDILMPVMDGFELCRKVKTDERLRRIPFIVYTATYTGPQDEAFAIKIGADRFLIKPCEPEALLAAICQVLATTRDAKDNSDPAPASDEEVFKLYNERLVRKLEQKMLQLERETAALREAETALRHSERKYRKLYESMTDGFGYTDMHGRFVESNESYRQMIGYNEEELVRMTYRDITPEKWLAFEEETVMRQLLAHDASEVFEKEYRHKDGRIFPVELRVFLVRDEHGREEGMWAIVRDLTERKRAEKQQKLLEEQLHQAQKMESIGRLAGGVAHDYNNMLSVILGYTQMALGKTEPGSPLQGDLQEILDAAKRSADITRQLLAFARKQAIVPQVLDLNDTVGGMLNMLRRLIGEDINLIWRPGLSLAPIKIDPSQFDQLLANLCINGRDAIGGVGSIVIETAEETLDETFCVLHAGVTPGRYVLLSVSDTGCGIDKENLDRIFEPFFTTKDRDKGTGLGLAMVYGIVRQNNGCIGVESEPGRGTTFRIHLPRHDEPVIRTEEENGRSLRTGRGETVLIVEDEAAILRMTGRVLENSGYKVVTATTPAEAIHLVEREGHAIRLVITDVIMPEMNGRDLVQLLLRHAPQLKCLFMSGYTAGVVAGRGVSDEDIDFIQKPFSADGLTTKVWEVLAGK
ncbi:MAG TPA: hybrid sensor histidine kinase/response regulator [Desulfobulbaceae bacterium]|nr:hybrid sensor histidine kinase/response regulator [Desulfobulbaceae bacterium]